ncbi:MAG: DEAD/DEAH box helicase [Bacillota bacterium]|nr:DEAD/DEAH box helicase [Bacillota bacterium]
MRHWRQDPPPPSTKRLGRGPSASSQPSCCSTDRRSIQFIILHAGVGRRQLLIWGEDTAVGVKVLSDPASWARRAASEELSASRAPRPKPHPYAADGDQLAKAIARTMPPFPRGARTAHLWTVGQLKAHLPAVRRLPLPSVPLAAPLPEAARVTVTPFAAPAVYCEPAGAIGLLLAASGRKHLCPGVFAGDDFLFWGQALSWALSLVARQRFLPGVASESGGLFARWQPMLTGPDQASFRALAQAMPGAAQAVRPKGVSRTLPGPPPSAPIALGEFLSFTVDHLVRKSLVQAPKDTLTGPARGRRAPASGAGTNIHDRWLAALYSETGKVDGRSTELAGLFATVADWLRPVTLRAAAPYRLCFRLEEPDTKATGADAGGEGSNTEAAEGAASDVDRAPASAAHRRPTAHPADTWRLRYLLQDAADPSLLLTAAQVWRGDAAHLALLRPVDLDAREYLLTALGQAAEVYLAIEGSLEDSAPAGLEFDSGGAHEFLTNYAAALEQAGFGVMLPAWWTGRGTRTRVGVHARVKASGFQASAGLGASTVVDFDWQLALGGDPITAAELRELARLKAPLVRVRGQWVQLDAAEIRTALDFWRRRKQAGAATLQETVRMALGAAALPGGLHLDGLAAEGPVADLLAQLEGRTVFSEVPVPEGFRGRLWPFQARGYAWLDFLSRFGLGACLADDMGLGKTIQTLAFVQRRWEADGRRPALLVCPTSVVGNWHKEAARFTPGLPVLVHSGPERAREAAAITEAVHGQALVVTSYALLQRDYPLLAEIDWAGLILDEAQNIKNPEAKQARAARSLRAGFRLALTGTPVENNVGDLWSIMECLNPGLLGTRADFRRRFFLPIQVQGDPGAAQQLKRATGPFILRRLKTDPSVISDLPEKVEARVFCTLTREQASLYAAVVAELEEGLDETEGIERRGRILAAFSKLKQVCNHPAHFLGDNSPLPGRSGKLARLVEMLEQSLAAGDRALIFTQFAVMGGLLQRFLQETVGCEVLFLHGGVPRRERDQMVERFQAGGAETPLFVLSLKAGGAGLNLTRANQVFHFDRWWNPAVENQATDRAFRIGQTRGVFVHKFVCLGTLEERIDELIERKRELSEQVIGSGEGWLTELTTAQLRELVALRAEAVRE